MFGNDNAIHEYFSHSDRVTCRAGEALLGKRFVKLGPGGSALVPEVIICGPGERPYGVAGRNAEIGARLTVFRAGILSITAGEPLTAGMPIAVGPGGTAVAATTGAVYGDVHADAHAEVGENAPVGEDAAVAISL